LIKIEIRRCGARWAAGAALVLGLAGPALLTAGPLHDGFVEQFQVGTWSAPGDFTLDSGFPAGLLVPAQLDTAWTEAAARVLAPDARTSRQLTARLLRRLGSAKADSLWRRDAMAALRDLIAARPGAEDISFLRAERLTMAFGRAITQGRYDAAASLAQTLQQQSARLGLTPREDLIWDLRARQARLLAGGAAAAAVIWWPQFVELGPFDTNNAWAMWVALRRQAGLPVLPTDGDPVEVGEVLGRLGQGWFSANDLYGSYLPPDWQAGLGAILLPKKDLGAHFEKFSKPPAHTTRQGWWLRGQRRMHAGDADAYERLARREDLKPTWRLDLWRRASERRLLKGEWEAGLADLQQALQLASQGRGTGALRKRLRQWTEQTLALALAREDRATAQRVQEWGLAAFHGAELEAFATEVRHWLPQLDPDGGPVGPVSDDPVDEARHLIACGAAPDIGAATPAAHAAFLAASDRQLWELWYAWGVTLANPTRVSGERRARAIVYREALLAGLEASDDEALADSALAVVALRLGDREWRSELLRTTVDLDAGHLCAWQTPPRPSPVPALLPEVRGSELDRHALLGFCLAVGDMRGIIGLAFELPGRGLTRNEKRLFLYPLPGPGPIRDAIAAAASEPALLLAVARNESLFEPAVRSRAGALGWMQIMPFHYAQNGALFGVQNWRTPATSVQRGSGLLTENQRRYAGDPYRVLAAYNAGPAAAARWDKQLGPGATRAQYLAWIGYTETRAYVEKVLIDREIYHAIIDAKWIAPTPNE
jgi:soluble lytic murein transglycosylase